MLTLYLVPGWSSMAPHIALHEIGVPFESRAMSAEDLLDPAYLTLNPERKVPTLSGDCEPLSEVAAILFYLGRRFPDAGLLPDGAEHEAQAISWMSFLASSVHPARRGGLDHALAVWSIAETRLGAKDWAVSDRYSIADIHLFRLFWRFNDLSSPPREDFPNLLAHHARMMARPAVRKTREIERALGIRAPG